MHTPEISFIITVYNKAKFLSQVLSAVKNQHLNVPCEYIIINDGSTDGSDRIIENIAGSWCDCNIIHQPNKGVIETTLTGIQQARGAFIKFVDGDDLLLPDLTHQQLTVLTSNRDLDYVACSFGWMDRGCCIPKFAYYDQITSNALEATDIKIFRGQNALWNVLSRKGDFPEALTGMSGGLSKKSSICIETASTIAKQYNMRQMQDHLISATSLLHENCSYAFIKKIGFIELSKSTEKDRKCCLSSISSRSRREQALINYALMEYLPKDQRLLLMHGDLKIMFRALHGKASFADKAWTFSQYNRTRSTWKHGNGMQIEKHYNQLMEAILQPTSEPY